LENLRIEGFRRLEKKKMERERDSLSEF